MAHPVTPAVSLLSAKSNSICPPASTSLLGIALDRALTLVLPVSLSFLISGLVANPSAQLQGRILIWSGFSSLTATAQAQASIISSLNSCNSLLTTLPTSFFALNSVYIQRHYQRSYSDVTLVTSPLRSTPAKRPPITEIRAEPSPRPGPDLGPGSSLSALPWLHPLPLLLGHSFPGPPASLLRPKKPGWLLPLQRLFSSYFSVQSYAAKGKVC